MHIIFGMGIFLVAPFPDRCLLVSDLGEFMHQIWPKVADLYGTMCRHDWHGSGEMPLEMIEMAFGHAIGIIFSDVSFLISLIICFIAYRLVEKKKKKKLWNRF